DPYALLLLVSLVLLAIIIILLSVWYIRYSRSKASRDGNNSRTIIGTVGGFQSHTKQTLNTGRNKIIWTFRIERFDAEGNRQPLVPVQMTARSFDGFVTNGDRVRVDVGSWKPGRILKPTSLYNEETQ